MSDGDAVFARWAQSYVARGFSPLPIGAGTKWPGFDGHDLKRWQGYTNEPADKFTLMTWAADKSAGIGLCTGFNGMVAVDVDNAKAYPAVREVFGHLHAPAKIGQRGATAFFFDPTGTVTNRNMAERGEAAKRKGPMLVEILCKGRVTVIPPTIHPGTHAPYRWHNGDLESCKPSDLPVITLDHVKALESLLQPLMPERIEMECKPLTVSPADLDEHMRRRYIGFARGTLACSCREIAAKAKPGRSSKLFGHSWTIGTLIKNGLLGENECFSLLFAAAEQCGLVRDNGRNDVAKNIRRGFALGEKSNLPDLEAMPERVRP
jgi:hypothetical protein